jgi:DNA polymerase III subunit alpha
VVFGDRPANSRDARTLDAEGDMLFLATNQQGYLNLMALTSSVYVENSHDAAPHIAWSKLIDHKEGLLAFTGGTEGPLVVALALGQPELAEARLTKMHDIFGDKLFMEIQRHGLDLEQSAEPLLLNWAYEKGIPLAATNGCYFASVKDYQAHDALLAIAAGQSLSDDHRRRLTPEHRFKTRAEMVALFADMPEATANTVAIAQLVHDRVRTIKPILPRFTLGNSEDINAEEAAELRAQAEKGLEHRLKAHGPAEGLTEKDYVDRLNFELDVITRMKYPGYFLIVADFIQWAKNNDIPVGPGRGSGAGSLTAYALTITDLDPLRFGLLFERFLNPERVSMPDFDIDFCQDRRDRVIEYVSQKYGHDRVAQIITFGTLQARGVMRDVGRVLDMPYGQVDRLCKLVPQNPANPVTLQQALNTEPKLEQEASADEVVRRMLDIAIRLEGLHRHASTHAAGIVIGDRPLQELVPLYRDPRSSMLVSQYNMKWVEQAGLVKFDFLGLKTLTVIQEAINLLKKRDINLDISTIPLDDPATFAMLGRGETVGVFQLESVGMRKALADMRADRFEDIIALVALYRPGPMANIPTYCARKHGLEQPDYYHPKIEGCLKETYGVIIYQEQVMQIAQVLAGYSLGEADLLRRAMGKKIKAEMDAQRARFVDGSVEGGLDKSHAEMIFDLLAKFADYGFNKSHAAAYALVAYQTAYLKANYPCEFMAASMTLDIDNTDKLSEFRLEATRLGLTIVPPNINMSHTHFEPNINKIYYALSALKGVGKSAVESVVSARGQRPFASLQDFAARLDPKGLNKRTLEALAASGSLDTLESSRSRAFSASEYILAYAQRQQADRSAGQFGLFAGENTPQEDMPLPYVDPWPAGRRLQQEHDAIGFYLSGHPLDDYQSVLKALNVDTWSTFERAVKKGAVAGRLAASVIDRTERRTKTGNKMGIITLSDPTGQFEAILFSESLALYRDILTEGGLVLLQVQASLEGEEARVRIQTVEPLDEAAKRVLGSMTIKLKDTTALNKIASSLEKGDDGKVLLDLSVDDEALVKIELPARYRVTPTVASMLRLMPGVEEVTLC